MRPRDPHEPGRSATPLELLFDLCFVVAVAQAATSLHHGVAEGHTGAAILGYGLAFFAIWWAWMGLTWFASAFDTDDPLYRVKVFVQIAGVLVLAAGVPRAFEDRDFTLITFGYAIMRAGLIAQWLRAAKANAGLRRTALRYAGGVAALQVGWLGLLAVPAELWIVGWLVLAPLELWVPWWAERAGATPWHPHHIAERYGLFTIIVIGESVLAATIAIRSAIGYEAIPSDLLAIILSAPVILFAMWWLYFSRPAHAFLSASNRTAFLWGYGHFFVFAAAAAVGAGIGVLVDEATGEAHLPAVRAGQALALPVALYLVAVWTLHLRQHAAGRSEAAAWLVAAGAVLAAPLTGWTAPVVALVLSLLTALAVATRRAAPSSETDPSELA